MTNQKLNNLLKDPNTNWKYVLIVAILAFLVGGGILGYQYWWLPKQEVEMPETKTPETGEETQESLRLARDTLVQFFSLLNEKKYAEAVKYYGGGYEVLRDWNPSVAYNDYAALFKQGCTVNGLQCLKVKRIVSEKKVSSKEFRFVIEFMDEDGDLFVRGPCCGATEKEMPPQSQFEFTVKKVEGRFLIMELPVYVP